jgi:hypothetical protein
MVAIVSSSHTDGAVPDGTVVVGAGVVVVVVGATDPEKEEEIDPDALDAVIVKL